jgi:hypothetical protein
MLVYVTFSHEEDETLSLLTVRLDRTLTLGELERFGPEISRLEEEFGILDGEGHASYNGIEIDGWSTYEVPRERMNEFASELVAALDGEFGSIVHSFKLQDIPEGEDEWEVLEVEIDAVTH